MIEQNAKNKELKIITICMGSSCYSRGNNKNYEIIKNFLKENSLEAEIIFKGTLCSNSCSKGPIIIIGDKEYTNVKPVLINDILSENFVLSRFN